MVKWDENTQQYLSYLRLELSNQNQAAITFTIGLFAIVAFLFAVEDVTGTHLSFIEFINISMLKLTDNFDLYQATQTASQSNLFWIVAIKTALTVVFVFFLRLNWTVINTTGGLRCIIFKYVFEGYPYDKFKDDMNDAGLGKYVKNDLEQEIKFIKTYVRIYNIIINVGIVALYAVNELTPISFLKI